MADRIVLLGPIRDRDGRRVVECAEVTPLDAGAFVSGGKWRVSLSRLTGELANATVLMRVKEWVAEPDEYSATSRAEDISWRACLVVCPEAKRFELAVPLPLYQAA
jgi:hypothetical protein